MGQVVSWASRLSFTLPIPPLSTKPDQLQANVCEGNLDTQHVTLHHLHHCCSPRCRLQTFFPSRSLSAALSKSESANSRFRRRFSSSSALSRMASETSSPPYFDFHL